MTSYQPDDILLVAFPFTGGGQTKNRPALALLDTGDADDLVARITTQSHQTPYDVAISDWQSAGLLAPSVIRLHKLAALAKALIIRRLGRLEPADRQRISGVLQQVYGRW